MEWTKYWHSHTKNAMNKTTMVYSHWNLWILSKQKTCLTTTDKRLHSMKQTTFEWQLTWSKVLASRGTQLQVGWIAGKHHTTNEIASSLHTTLNVYEFTVLLVQGISKEIVLCSCNAAVTEVKSDVEYARASASDWAARSQPSYIYVGS